jgi:hypothetical protein
MLEAWPVSADQFILFNNKIQGIGQRDTRIDMLLNNLSSLNGVSFSVRP